MNCYKCGGDKELSIKARHRDGRVRALICRSCRRAASKAYNAQRITPIEEIFPEQIMKFRRLSRETVCRISKRAREGAWAS